MGDYPFGFGVSYLFRVGLPVIWPYGVGNASSKDVHFISNVCIYFLNRKISDYRVMVVLSYLIIHGIMWCTIWAIYYLPIKQHANEGFIIMHLMFFAVGFCAPFKYGTIAHCLVITNIILSNTFNHYESFDMMLTLGIPCVVAICAVQYVMEQVYTDQFLTRRQLEKALTLDYLTKAYNRNKLKDICDEAGSKLLVAAEKETYILVVDIDFLNV